jgi:hypothetical protein
MLALLLNLFLPISKTGNAWIDSLQVWASKGPPHKHQGAESLLWELLSQSGAGVSRTLKTGNPQQIAQFTFWTALKCLDVMSQIRKNNFEDDPIVSSELVKFLNLNTGFEVAKRMWVKIKALKEANNNLTVKVNSKIKTWAKAAAKVVKLLNKFTALEKRVKVLEK